MDSIELSWLKDGYDKSEQLKKRWQDFVNELDQKKSDDTIWPVLREYIKSFGQFGQSKVSLKEIRWDLETEKQGLIDTRFGQGQNPVLQELTNNNIFPVVVIDQCLELLAVIEDVVFTKIELIYIHTNTTPEAGQKGEFLELTRASLLEPQLQEILDKLDLLLKLISALNDKLAAQAKTADPAKAKNKKKATRALVYQKLLDVAAAGPTGPMPDNIGLATQKDYSLDPGQRDKDLAAMGTGLALIMYAKKDNMFSFQQLKILREVSQAFATNEAAKIKAKYWAEMRSFGPLSLAKKGLGRAGGWLSQKIDQKLKVSKRLNWLSEKTGAKRLAGWARRQHRALKEFDRKLSNKTNVTRTARLWRKGKQALNLDPVSAIATIAIGGANILIQDTIKKVALAAGVYEPLKALGNGLGGTFKFVGGAANLVANVAKNGATAALVGGGVAGLTAGGAAILPGAAALGITGGIVRTALDLFSGSKDDFRASPITTVMKGVNALDNGFRRIFGKVLGIEGKSGIFTGYMRTYLGNTNNWSQLFSKNIYLDQLATGARKLYSGAITAMRATSDAINGAGIGSVLGTVLLGGILGVQTGALIGAVAGGIGFAGGRVLLDRFGDGLAQKLAAGKLFPALANLPLKNIEGLISGERWLQTQARILFGKATPLEKQIYGLDLNNPLSIAMNATNLIAYFASFSGINASILGGGFGKLGQYFTDLAGGESGVFKSLGNVFSRFGGGELPTAIQSAIQSADITIAGRVISFSRLFNIGTIVGGTLGSIVGAALASSFGLTVGLGAAIGGAIGATAGGIIGAAVIGGSTFGLLTVFGATVGSFFGSAIGTVLGSLVDTLLNKILPSIPSPLVIFQGIYDLYRWLTTPIRNISDYAALGMIALSLVNFLVVFQRLFAPSDTATGGAAATAYLPQTQLQFAASNVNYRNNHTELVLNPSSKDDYSFSGISGYQQTGDGKVTFSADGRYWVLTNPGQVLYNPVSNSLNGSGQNVVASVFATSAVAGASTFKTDNNTSTSSSLTQISFCTVFTDLCKS